MNSQKELDEFYQHPFIQSIKDRPHWSISDKDKRPIDIKWLIATEQIRGANLTTDYNPLVSLSDLIKTIPNPTNCAYYLDAVIDNFVVMDIEPICPDEIKQKLLNTDFIYGEISLSGKGYHLIYELPKSFSKYPIAQTKIAMKGENKYYEILLNHWVTFTGKQISKPEHPTDEFQKIFETLAAAQKETVRTDIEIEDLRPEDIFCSKEIINVLSFQHYYKTPKDFDNDNSRYEYGHMGYLHYKLNCMCENPAFKNKHTYTPNEKAWILYEVAKQQIPYREKHETIRDGLPWLLYLAQEIIAKSKPKEQEDERK